MILVLNCCPHIPDTYLLASLHLHPRRGYCNGHALFHRKGGAMGPLKIRKPINLTLHRLTSRYERPYHSTAADLQLVNIDARTSGEAAVNGSQSHHLSQHLVLAGSPTPHATCYAYSELHSISQHLSQCIRCTPQSVCILYMHLVLKLV